MPTNPVVRATTASSGRFHGLTVDPLEDATAPSSPAPTVFSSVKPENSFETSASYARRCLNDVFNKKAPDIHRAQALYQIFIATASELETTSHFTAVMTRIAENLSELGCKTQPSAQHCDRSHCEPCTLEHAEPCTMPHAAPCVLPHAEPCVLPHFFITPEPCPLPHAEPCKILHVDPCTLSHAEPCTLAHNEPCQLTHAETCTLNHFPLEPVTVAVTIPCPLAHNDLCTREHVLTRPSSPPILPPIPSSPVKRNLIDSSSSKQMKRKRFKSTKKRKVNDIDTAQTLAKCFGSEPEMDSDGLFPNPIYGYKDAIDEFMNEDSIDDSFMLDREIRAFDRDYPFADQLYEIPQVSIPAAPTPVTSAAPLPLSSLLATTATLPLPKMDLPRARTEPLPSKPTQTALPSRAQTAPPEVSKNTLTARRCTNKDASPSSFVKFMDVPVTMTREHIHDCLKNNRRWSTVDISNVEIFAIRNKDSTVVNILKIKFKDDAQSTTAKRVLTTIMSMTTSNVGAGTWQANNFSMNVDGGHWTFGDNINNTPGGWVNKQSSYLDMLYGWPDTLGTATVNTGFVTSLDPGLGLGSEANAVNLSPGQSHQNDADDQGLYSHLPPLLLPPSSPSPESDLPHEEQHASMGVTPVCLNSGTIGSLTPENSDVTAQPSFITKEVAEPRTLNEKSSRFGRTIIPSTRLEKMNAIGSNKENIPQHVATSPSNEWVTLAKENLLTLDLGEEWRSCVKAWLALEELLDHGAKTKASSNSITISAS
ncbi:hypothetical protein JOM56_000863 [Amanita muscaria]